MFIMKKIVVSGSRSDFPNRLLQYYNWGTQLEKGASTQNFWLSEAKIRQKCYQIVKHDLYDQIFLQNVRSAWIDYTVNGECASAVCPNGY